jgi:hypothetical protein
VHHLKETIQPAPSWVLSFKPTSGRGDRLRDVGGQTGMKHSSSFASLTNGFLFAFSIHRKLFQLDEKQELYLLKSAPLDTIYSTVFHA